MSSSDRSPGDTIRHLASAWGGDRIVIGAFERHVAVWDVRALTEVARFETVFDFGGSRLAITSDGERVIAGAYTRYGIACYDASSGETLWQRKDIKGVQHLSVSADDKHVFCSFSEGTAKSLNLETGEIHGRMRGANSVTASPFDPVLFMGGRDAPGYLCSLEGGKKTPVGYWRSPVLSSTFAPGRVITSNGGGPIRCFQNDDARHLWSWQPMPQSHAVEVGYDQSGNCVVAVVRPLTENRNDRLCRIDVDTGDLLDEFQLADCDGLGFCLSGTRMLANTGQLFDTSLGRSVTSLDFAFGEGTV